MSSESSDTLAEIASRLETTLSEQVVPKLNAVLQWRRRFVIGLTIGIGIILLYLGFVSFLYVRLHDSQIDNCRSSNQTRTAQEQLWVTLFDLAARDDTRQPSAQAKRLTDEFLADVRETYAQVDCTTRYPFW